jgi:hypothetical protein
MRILAIERERPGAASQLTPVLLRDEAAAVWALQKSEVIREIWFTCATKCAVVLLECASEAEARQHLAALPLVRAGCIEFDVHALRSYDGFDRLLS